MRDLSNFLPVLDRGHIFRARRVQLGLTLDELKEQSGLSASAIRRVESKTTATLAEVQQVASVLDLTHEEAVAMHAVQHQEFRPSPGDMAAFRRLVPALASGRIFRARRSQLDMSREVLAKRSGISAVLIGELELSAGVDLEVVHALAPHLEVTPTQAYCMLAIQRRDMVPECLRKML